MSYRSLQDCVVDLERNGHLVRVREEVDPHLELAEIQRRAYQQGAPALLFDKVKGCRFRALSNLFGDIERCRFIFRKTIERVKKMVRLKADPSQAWKSPFAHTTLPFAAMKSLPLKGLRQPVMAQTCALSDLPQIQSWPDDGGPFITLPQVFTEDLERPGVMNSNLGMYRVQLAGNQYEAEKEIGLHYQIHRGIGVHHAKAITHGEPLRVSIFVGGPPAHTLAAVMPLPEGLSELLFAGMLSGRHFRYRRKNCYVISSDADFCITGTIDPNRLLPEGPFGDHLGYYSLAHDFPVMQVDKVFHRRDAIWPFTVVGRPPQEDTSFGELIHEITAPMVPVELPGVSAIHAVDAAGVHPLLLAIGSERYAPYQERRPQEILTQANAILGFGQCSLAKFLLILAREDVPDLAIHKVQQYLIALLERVDWSRDLHFQTRTTMDTLDYSGERINEGSKLVVASAGAPRRKLASEPPDWRLPSFFGGRAMALPGVLLLEAPNFESDQNTQAQVEALTQALSESQVSSEPNSPTWPLIVLTEDAEFAAQTLENFLWVTFTRANPSHDVHGIDSFVEHKHWGCRGPLIIDARLKPHHAPPLIEDARVSQRVDELCGPGRSLHGVL